MIKHEVVAEFMLTSSNGDDNRECTVFKVETKNGVKYVLYQEAYFHYECTRNDDGVNIVILDENCSIEVGSETTDFHYWIYSSYEECINNIYSVEDLGYYTVKCI